MSRQLQKQNLNGWLVIDKKAGYTSTSVVNKIKWLLNAKKAGHAGTLDPDATGILAIALGEATKTIPYITGAPKTYQFKIYLGAATDTDDTSGKTIKISNTRPTDTQLTNVLTAFLGNIKQVPPNYSAIKINGNRAYQLARNGLTELKLQERNLQVEKLELIKRINSNEAIMRMVCGKGGYVRSIARDIGEKLSCFAHAGEIRRLSSGPFTLSNSISHEIIFKKDSTPIFEKIRPIQSALYQLDSFKCSGDDVKNLRNGKKISIDEYHFEENSEIFVYFQNVPIAIGRVKNSYFYPKRVFNYVFHE